MSETPLQLAFRESRERFAEDQREREELNEAHRLYGNAPGELVAGMVRVGRLDPDAYEQQVRSEKSVKPLPQFEGERTMFERETYKDFAARHSVNGQPISYKGWILFPDGAAVVQQNECVRMESDHPDAKKVKRDYHIAWAQRLRKEANRVAMLSSYQWAPDASITDTLNVQIAAHERAVKQIEAGLPDSPVVAMNRELLEIQSRQFAAEVGPRMERQRREQAMNQEERDMALMLGNPR